MVPKITFHSRENHRTTTLRTERDNIAENKIYELKGSSGTLLNEHTVYEEMTKVKTPFLLGVPRIAYPLKDQVVTDAEFKSFEISEAIFSDEFIGKLTHVEWQIARDENFEELIYNKILPYENDQDRFLPAKSLNLTVLVAKGYIRARYFSNLISSPYTQALRFKVANKVINQPKVSVHGEGINIEFRVSEFSINPENGNDMYVASMYRLFKVPKEELDIAGSYYELDNKYLLTEFTKKATDINSLKVSFPMIANDQEIKLVAGEHIYVLQVRQKGKIYTSEIGLTSIDASGMRVDTPSLKILDNELMPIIDISKFRVSTGDDDFTKYEITIYEVNDLERTEKIIHEKTTVYNQYIIPFGVCKSNKTYKVKVVAYGTNYMESLPGEIQFSLKEIGIRAPRINLQNLGMEPKFTLDQFTLVNCKDTWVGTEWELYIHGNLIDNNLNPITSLFKVYWTDANKNVLQLAKTELEPNTNYIMKVRFVGEKYKSNWAVMEFKSTELDIGKPKLYVKLEGLNFTMDVSEYIVRGATDTPKEVWYYVDELDPSSIEEEKYIAIGEPFKVPYYKKAISINKKNGIKKDTKYRLRAKIIGEYFTTPFSDPIYMTTENIYVKPPTVSITGYPNRVPKRPTITTSPFQVTADNDIHLSTTWIIQERTENGLIDVFKSEQNTKNLTSLVIVDDILKVKTDYLLTVIHYGDDYGASDPVTISFRTRNSFMVIPMDGPDGMQEIIIGDDEDQNSPKYFGKIPYENLIDDRNYLGDWDNSKRYKKGEQVFYNNKLWYSLTNDNENRTPGVPTQEGVSFWKIDDRQELPTYKWVLEHIGFPVGVKCSIDKLSDGYEYVGSYRDGVKASVDKFAFEGRILYVYDKVELENICYNDLVKMNIHGTRTRTIRISNRLYWVRSMTSREYIELRTLKKLDTENIIDIELNVASYVSDSDQVGNKFRLVNNEFYKTEERNPLIRDVGLRLCLEYIPEEEEPWIYYKNMYPELVYDKYTDTGYFGTIDKVKGNIYDELGITAGTKINKDAGYLAFYSHGKRLLVNRMPIVFGIGYEDLKNIGVLYDREMVVEEEYHPAYVTNLMLPNGDKPLFSARIMKGGAFAYKDLGVFEDNEIKATDLLCKYSEWNELLYRVSQFEPKHVDRLYSHGGFQIGKNWDNYDNINLGVFEHYSGNGCHVYVSSICGDKYVMSRGGVRLEAVHWIEMKDIRNDYGLRLVLEDMTEVIPEEYIPINKPKPDLPWVSINPDTVIKTDPLDKYPEIPGSRLQVPLIGLSDQFKLYEFKDNLINTGLSNDTARYEEQVENNINSDPGNMLNPLLLLCNNEYYVIKDIKKYRTQGELVKDESVLDKEIYKLIENNGFVFEETETNCSWGYTSRPALRHDKILIDGKEEKRCNLYFGMGNDVISVIVGDKLTSDRLKQEYLLSVIDENGNGEKVKNYKYDVLEVNTAKANLYTGYDLSVPYTAYNEITKFDIILETISLEVAMKLYDKPISRVDADFDAWYVPDTHLEKITDEIIKYKTDTRVLNKVKDLVNYDLNTVTFINKGNTLVRVDYVTTPSSGIGSYDMNSLFEHTTSPYIDSRRYVIANSISCMLSNGVIYISEGYRTKGLNSEESDLFVDLIITNEEIANTNESKSLYLEEHNKTFIKVIDISVKEGSAFDLVNGTLTQIKDINVTVEDKFDLATPTNNPNNEPTNTPEDPVEEINDLSGIEFVITKES